MRTAFRTNRVPEVGVLSMARNFDLINALVINNSINRADLRHPPARPATWEKNPSGPRGLSSARLSDAIGKTNPFPDWANRSGGSSQGQRPKISRRPIGAMGRTDRLKASLQPGGIYSRRRSHSSPPFSGAGTAHPAGEWIDVVITPRQAGRRVVQCGSFLGRGGA